MNITLTRLGLAIASAGLLTIYGCGGGGGTASTGGSGASTITLGGINAVGAAFTDATITVVDSRGITVGTSSVVGANGVFSITLAAGAVAPFILTSSRKSADGAVESLVSVVPSVTGSSATVNITPVTNLIASRLSSSGDPLKLAAELAAGTTVVNSTTLTAKVAEVQAILAPILTATGTSSTDPLTGTFAVTGSGYDRLLDSIKVTITPNSATTTAIEVGIKEAQAGVGTAPTTIQFDSSQSVAAITAGNSITANSIGGNAISDGNLVVAGTSALIADHLAQLTACYALSTAQRVDAPNPSSLTIPTASNASSTNIIATACRDAFIGGSTTIAFKSNGSQIGAVAGKPFRGLFYEAGTGTIFSQGTYEFTRSNGDVVVGYKSKSVNGSETFDTFALRLDNTDRKLKQIGNEYVYPGGVSAYHQKREFITNSQSPWNYYSTGYSISIADVTVLGSSIFDRVVVTTPTNHTLTLKPNTGYSLLTLVSTLQNSINPSTPNGSGTSFVRLNSEYVDTTNTFDPAAKDTAALYFANRATFTNAYIAAIPAQAVWKFEYYLATAPSTIAQTQYYKTRARALTIPELKTRGLATLAVGDISTIQAAVTASPWQLPIATGSAQTINYLVPAGALPPTSLQVWGGYSGGSFNDSVTVLSTALSGNVACSNVSGSGDTHCTTGTSVKLNGMHLWARDIQGREYASFYAMYFLP